MTQSIRQWLEHLGLTQYADAFLSNHIDVELLPQITDQVLKDIGVASAGHRLRILQSVATLPAHAVAQVPTDTSPERRARPTADAERRQLTIMFCDLVGSTALAQELDPEQLRELMQSYQQTCGNVIEKYDGHVAQYLGDGLMTYFGWPKAHENDAERAVRSGIAIIAAIKSVCAEKTLAVRIGIATGPVVVGATGGGDASIPKLAVGETPNLAARLQGLAQADQIVIAPSTHRLLASAFEYQDLGAQNLKGIVEQVHA